MSNLKIPKIVYPGEQWITNIDHLISSINDLKTKDPLYICNSHISIFREKQLLLFLNDIKLGLDFWFEKVYFDSRRPNSSCYYYIEKIESFRYPTDVMEEYDTILTLNNPFNSCSPIIVKYDKVYQELIEFTFELLKKLKLFELCMTNYA